MAKQPHTTASNKRRDETATTRPRSVRHLRCPPHGGRELRVLPRGLVAMEREWIQARAAQVGGLTAAFRHLVRLGILHDAAVATWMEHTRLLRQAHSEGLSRAAIEQRVKKWAKLRAAEPLADRLINLMIWRRPGTPDGYGRAPEDDPSEPLPRPLVRRLIAEGRPVFNQWPVGE